MGPSYISHKIEFNIFIFDAERMPSWNWMSLYGRVILPVPRRGCHRSALRSAADRLQ